MRRMTLTAAQSVCALITLCAVVPSVASELRLTGSVGKGGNNEVADVKAVQSRLKELGFGWVAVDGVAGPATNNAIRLFQAIKNGDQRVDLDHNDGRVDVNGDTHKWLEADNAPRWMKLASSGDGFVNIELQDDNDNHDFGTSWLNEVIIAAGKTYMESYLRDHDASLITINDASLPMGGNTSDHKGHETGMAIDLRLPKKGGEGAAPGGRTYITRLTTIVIRRERFSMHFAQ